MREITLEELLEAGCHFGHQITRSNPKARDFIFEARENIHIIDLAKTKEGLEAAASYVRELAEKADTTFLVVGTKRQAQSHVEEEVKRAKSEISGKNGIFYVTNRWIGGTLTNFSEIIKNCKKLKDLTSRLASEEEKARYTKKEIGLWEKERQKLQRFYGGILDMEKIPDALFIIDTHLEELAVEEANKMGVTTVGIVDTNADPFVIDYPIPANDDALGSIKLITSYIIDAWIEGRKNLESKVQNSQSKAGPPLAEELEKEKTKQPTSEAKTTSKTKRAAKPKTPSKAKEKGSKNAEGKSSTT